VSIKHDTQERFVVKYEHVRFLTQKGQVHTEKLVAFKLAAMSEEGWANE
jgi:hypothetical protein